MIELCAHANASLFAGRCVGERRGRLGTRPTEPPQLVLLEEVGDDRHRECRVPARVINFNITHVTRHHQVSYYTFLTPLASSMMAPGLPTIAAKLDITSETILAMTLSIFLLTFAIGPLVMAPLSEIYGRTWVMHISNLMFLAFNLGCAFAPTTSILIGMRLLCKQGSYLIP